MSKIEELYQQQGQSIWIDYIRRAFIDSGELQAWIDKGVRGVTSNPSIFEKAIGGSSDYDEDLKKLVQEGKTVLGIYEALALDDIAEAADLFEPLYEESNGGDGYVSFEVNPTLANDTEGTLTDTRRLNETVGRENVMFKVPATPAGIPAIETLTAEGININITLIFSLEQYEQVANAYMSGLEKLAAQGGDLSKVASVASVFISRLEGPVNEALAEVGRKDLQGKTAVANGKRIYARFEELFSSERWQKLADQGANIQRPLWGSTSVKNPEYPDTMYVDNLIGPHTVNTVPLETLNAFHDHGTVARTVNEEVTAAHEQFEKVKEAGVDLDAIFDHLLEEGVEKFSKSFEKLLGSISTKRERVLAEERLLSADLGPHQAAVDQRVAKLKEDCIMQRIWERDHTVWKPEPDEITNRLGWLDIASRMEGSIGRLQNFVKHVRDDGYTDVLLLGMGGSSLAPEVFSEVFGTADGYLDLEILDSTDPAAVAAQAERLDYGKTLFIVSTKSGTTAETLSFFKYFYNQVAAELGEAKAGEHFVAITDPGSKLIDLAEKHEFRDCFINDPNIGGRYSVLSYFGLVPAALLGIDLKELLGRAQEAAVNCDSCNCPQEGDNSGGYLGAIMGELARAGRDKVTFIMSDAISNFGDWVEQLIAESTGKEGKGILPVVTEPVGEPDAYGDDRLFVYLKLADDETHDAAVQALAEAGQPVIRMVLKDKYAMGGQFFLWEMATAVAGYVLGIHPFDQPNVEAAKKLARKMIDAYQESGERPQSETAELSKEKMDDFLEQAEAGDYAAVHAYIPLTEKNQEQLLKLGDAIRSQHGIATTVGFGPRFLHSTGQLHKGDGGNGLFIQLTSDAEADIDIPDEAGSNDSSISFGVLKLAQAVGDGQALKEADRRVIRFHLGTDVEAGLKRLTG